MGWWKVRKYVSGGGWILGSKKEGGGGGDPGEGVWSCEVQYGVWVRTDVELPPPFPPMLLLLAPFKSPPYLSLSLSLSFLSSGVILHHIIRIFTLGLEFYFRTMNRNTRKVTSGWRHVLLLLRSCRRGGFQAPSSFIFANHENNEFHGTVCIYEWIQNQMRLWE